MQGFLIENAAIVCGAVPIDCNGVGVTGKWVNFKHYRRAEIIIQQGAWAGGTAAVTLNQGKTNTGGSTKSLSFTRYFKSTGLSTTTDAPVTTAVTSDTFSLTAVANIISVIPIHCDDLDKANGFLYFNCVVATPGSNADLISIHYILYDGDLAVKPDNRPITVT
jgi:hypothetical protein